jgi:hypothetical protein
MAAQLLQESDAWQLVEDPSAVPVAVRTVPVTVTS